ncbi:hypothetical protein EOA64_00520 [Mesorhizobium sp. M1A.F.Ca.IN.022.02.1.1]|uniref:hypothetical protein n=1 Tax=Mesorhizobium sp. M1A.F.Ca.IN.022.02.1.1 TaxID=2496766 RepID=UPI000FCB46B6|nr:hypothetical protein [Mesorhizobium sp. M1A.F.Ca.IN.022.02.1.1]RUV65862.1 hypothetical protein EOA64_00520 [Mesorhizobium sp. M1A.F.Ca.IN.022.02.1.1]RWI33385.1 MAG: hypothetical protein EOR13_17680 [Mesorhizobium sp.]
MKDQVDHIERVYYRIRFPAKAGAYGEFYTSNNGTSQWADIAKVKALLRRGQPVGYKGRILKPFEDYEVIKMTETIQARQEVVTVTL